MTYKTAHARQLGRKKERWVIYNQIPDTVNTNISQYRVILFFEKKGNSKLREFQLWILSLRQEVIAIMSTTNPHITTTMSTMIKSSEIGNTNIRIIFLFIGNSQWCFYLTQSSSYWLSKLSHL